MLKKIKKYSLYFLILVYVSGAIGFIIKPSFFAPFTPYTLILTTAVFLIHQPLNKPGYTLGFLAVVLIGFTSEVVGIKTGIIFGHYYYGSALGTKLWGVPLVISLNWAFLVCSGILIANKLLSNKVAAAFLSAAIVTATDLLIEQVAPLLDFWYFKNGRVSLHNYLGWFVISLASALWLQSFLSKGNSTIAYVIVALQILFFGTIFIFKVY